MAMAATWRFDRKRRRLLQQRRRGRRHRGARTAAHHRANDRADPHPLRQLVGRQLYGGAGRGFFKPFTAATGIQIRVVTPVSYGKIKAQVQTRRYEFDMTSINSMQWLRATREGLGEPIDWSVVNKDRDSRRTPSSPTASASRKTSWGPRCAIAPTDIPAAAPNRGRISGT